MAQDTLLALEIGTASDFSTALLCHALAFVERDLDALLAKLSRLRYLELRHPTLPDLLEYDRFNEWQRAALDAGWGSRKRV